MTAYKSYTSLDPLPDEKPAKSRTRLPRLGRDDQRPRPRSRYDAADTGQENQNHWANADSLSASAANSPGVREKLRNRSRYEKANNGYYKGLIRGRTNDTIGCGPRLQLELPERFIDPDFRRAVPTGGGALPPDELAGLVERAWCEWAESVGLTDKIRLLAEAEDTDGEGLAVFLTNDRLDGVQLDVRVLECDRLTTPGGMDSDRQVDGIRLDAAGNPAFYHILRRHPGDLFRLYAGSWEYDSVPADRAVHLFEHDRPEQYRGVPLMAAALPLYAIMRRYTLASLGSAELAAMIAGVIENPNAPIGDGDDDAPEFEAMDAVPFARNALLTLAGGQTAKAFKSEQPAPSYKEFKGEILTEAGRSAGEMRNTATGSSAEYNYSSGRLDHLPRQRAIRIRRERFERKLLDRVFRLWVREASLLPDHLPAGLPPVEEWEWKWQWDGFESIDPLKDARAAQVRKETGLATDADELAAAGKDWRTHYKQLSLERELREKLGLPHPGEVPAAEVTPEEEEEAADA